VRPAARQQQHWQQNEASKQASKQPKAYRRFAG